MIGEPRDLPLDRDEASRYLPWAVGLLVLLGTVALAAAMVLSTASDAWRSNLTGTLTVQIPRAAPGEAADAADAVARNAESLARQKRQVDAALEVLRATPGVSEVRVIPNDQIAELLEPWLGRQALSADLPMPALIDVRTTSAVSVDTAALAARLQDAAPGAAVDDHAVWLRRLSNFAVTAEALSLGIMALILISAVATVVFTTRTGLAIHRDVIEVLHLIGAQDRYVARQFQIHALRLSAIGAVAGFGIAAASLYVISVFGAKIEGGLLPSLSLDLAQWGSLFAIPAGAVILVVLTAGLTVTRYLGRMM